MAFHLDYEAASECDIDAGAYRYSEDPSTRILMFAIAKDEGEPYLWTFLDPYGDESLAAEALLVEAIASNKPIYAHNAQFEVAMSTYRLEKDVGVTPPDINNWRCTQAMCRRAAAPEKLAEAASFFRLADLKDPIGKALVDIFSKRYKMTTIMPPVGMIDPATVRPMRNGKFTKGKKPKNRKTPSPILDEEIMWDWSVKVSGNLMTVREAWDKFCEYCRQDVRVERVLHKHLSHFELRGSILESFLFDLRMNWRGVPVNVNALQNANGIVEAIKEKLSTRFFKMTGFMPSQRDAVQAWLKERGYPEDNLQAGTVDKILEAPPAEMTPMSIEALRLRSLISFAALAKIPTMLGSACSDGRVRGSTQWHAARTGRAGGRIIQPQNFRKSTIADSELCYRLICEGWDPEWFEELWESPLEAIASSIRHFIHPPNGSFFDGDFVGVEARITPWLAGDKAKLGRILDGIDPYKHMATLVFGVEYDAVKKIQRTICKPIELGCCIAEGELVRTDRGLVAIEDVTPQDLVWDGVEWVKQDGVIFQGEREVVTYQGLSATEDHNVWVENRLEKLPFRQAISEGLTLRTTGEDDMMPNLSTSRRTVRVYDLLNAGPRHRFTVSNKLVSNCFGVGAKGLQEGLAKPPYNVSRTRSECKEYVKIYRDNHPETVAAWKEIEESAKSAIRNPGKKFYACDEKLSFQVGRTAGMPYLVMRLPSGRGLYYPKPQVKEVFKKYDEEEMVEDPWKREKGGYTIDQISFYGKIQTTNQWGRIGTWGSRLFENAVQAIGADLLNRGCIEAERRGYPIAMIIHDQALCESHFSKGNLDGFLEAMCAKDAWAESFPLAADGAEHPYYLKED